MGTYLTFCNMQLSNRCKGSIKGEMYHLVGQIKREMYHIVGQVKGVMYHLVG